MQGAVGPRGGADERAGRAQVRHAVSQAVPAVLVVGQQDYHLREQAVPGAAELCAAGGQRVFGDGELGRLTVEGW